MQYIKQQSIGNQILDDSSHYHCTDIEHNIDIGDVLRCGSLGRGH